MDYGTVVQIIQKVKEADPADVSKALTQALRVKHMKYDTFVDTVVKDLENKTSPQIFNKMTPEDRFDIAKKLKAVNPIRNAFKGLLTPEQWNQVKSSLGKYPTIAKLIGKI